MIRWPLCFFRLPLACALLLAGTIAWAEKRTPAPSGWSTNTPAATTAPAGASSSEWLGDRERGWHWYEVEPEPPSTPIPEPPPEGRGSASPQDQPAPWSSAWLRAELPKALERAVDDPTTENVAYHSLLQRVAIERAEKFAYASVETNALNPTLDTTVDDPVSSFARGQLEKISSEQREEALTKLGEEVGIWYFYASTCQYCKRMNNTLRTFLDRHSNFTILPIAIDHQSMPDGSFPNWVPDSGQAQGLGVTQTPTLFVFRPPRKLIMLGVGALSAPAMEKKLLQIAKRENWISEDDYNRAMKGKTRQMLLDRLKLIDGIDWQDPKQTMAVVNALNMYGKQEDELDDSLLPSTAIQPTTHATDGGTP
jgi:conjugal transfer pilus assembly protein TraF